MLDWDVTDDDKPFPQEADTTMTLPHWRRWWVWLVLFIVVASAGGVVLYQQVQRGEDAMRRDLLVFIRREEQARRLGQQENADGFLPDSNIPPGFAVEYERLFTEPPIPVGVEVMLAEFDMEGDTAQVMVGLGAQHQRRAYRLTPDGWRRVPLNAEWGEQQSSTDASGAITIQFYDSDTAFAQALLEDAPTIFSQFATLGYGLQEETAIRIEPCELETVLPHNCIVAVGPVLEINSPQLVEIPSHWTLSSEAAIKYSLIEHIWHSLGIRTDQSIPQHGRFTAAMLHVMALRWATEHDTGAYDQIVALWRTTATANGWQSPFDSTLKYDFTLDPFAPTAEEAAMLLVVDSVYARQGVAGIAAMESHIYQQSPNGWDAVFQTTLGENTAELEAEARADGVATSVPSLPLSGHITTEEQNDVNDTFSMTIAGYNQPITIDAVQNASLTFIPSDGSASLTLPASCLSLFPQATVEGAWRETGTRLAATHITIEPTTFAATFQHTPPPSDTVAYVGTGDSAFVGGPYTSIAAMNATSSVTPVLTSTEGAFRLYGSNITGSANGVFVQPTSVDQRCQIARVAWYDFTTGLVGEWMFNWSPTTTNYYPILTWDAVANEGLLFLSTFDQAQQTPYWRLRPGDNRFLHQPDGVIPAGQLSAVRPGAQEVLLLKEGRRLLQRVAIDTGEVLDTYTLPPDTFASALTYSSDGNHLVMAWTTANDKPSDIVQYDLRDNAITSLWRSPATPIYSLRADTQLPRFYAQTQTVTIGDRAPSVFTQSDTVDIIGYAPLLVAIGDDAVPLFVGTPADQMWQHWACRHGGLGYQSASASFEGLAAPPDTGPMLRLVTADGDPRYSPIPLPPTVVVLACE